MLFNRSNWVNHPYAEENSLTGIGLTAANNGWATSMTYGTKCILDCGDFIYHSYLEGDDKIAAPYFKLTLQQTYAKKVIDTLMSSTT